MYESRFHGTFICNKSIMQCLVRFTGRISERVEYFEFPVVALGENGEYIAAQ